MQIKWMEQPERGSASEIFVIGDVSEYTVYPSDSNHEDERPDDSPSRWYLNRISGDPATPCLVVVANPQRPDRFRLIVDHGIVYVTNDAGKTVDKYYPHEVFDAAPVA